MLRALRQRHGVPLDDVRRAVAIAEAELGIDRLLVDPRLKASAGTLFLDRYYDLVELTASQQIAMRVVLARYLQRIEYGPDDLPTQFFPFERIPDTAAERVISLSPFVAFGKAVVERRGVSTRAITDRLDAGESKEDLIQDYDLTEAELEEAILFEAAA